MENKLILKFYSEHPPSDEDEISEVVASEVISDFIDVPIEVERITLAPHNKILPRAFGSIIKKND